MVEIFATGDVGAAAGVVARDDVDHQGLGAGEIVGVEGFCHVVAPHEMGSPRSMSRIADLIAAPDRAAARLSWSGTRINGDRVRRETIEIVRVAGGLAAEHWGSHLE